MAVPILICGLEEAFHHESATEDGPLVDGEVVASPHVGGEEEESRNESLEAHQQQQQPTQTP